MDGFAWVGVFWEGSRRKESVSWCVLQTPGCWGCLALELLSKPDSCSSPGSHQSQIPGNVVAGNSAVPAEGAFGTQPPQHSPNPNPARPRLFLQRSSPPFLSPFGKLRNKNPMLNAIPCVALRTCCRMSLQSPEEGGGSSSSPVFQPLNVQEGAPSPAR